MEIEMKIKGLVVDPISKMPIVVLEDPRSEQDPADLDRRLRSQRDRPDHREHPHAPAR